MVMIVYNSFTRYFLDYADFKQHNDLTFLSSLEYNHEFFKTNLISPAVVINDDFQPLKNAELPGFRAILNHALRHSKITLFLVGHAKNKINYYNEMSLSSYFFLTKSEISRKFIDSHKNRGSYLEEGFKRLQLYEILFLNFKNEYSIIINITEDSQIRFKNMFYEDDIFVIHPENDVCSKSDVNLEKIYNIDHSLSEDELLSMYSKHSRKFKIIYSCLKRNDLIKNDQIILSDTIAMHLCDFLNIMLSTNMILAKKKFSKDEILFLKNLLPMSKFPYPVSIFPNSIRKYLKLK